MTTLTESTVETATIGWLADLGWSLAHGPDIAPDTTGAERTDYGEVLLARRLRDALARLNPDLPAAVLRDTLLPKLISGELLVEGRGDGLMQALWIVSVKLGRSKDYGLEPKSSCARETPRLCS